MSVGHLVGGLLGARAASAAVSLLGVEVGGGEVEPGADRA